MTRKALCSLICIAKLIASIPIIQSTYDKALESCSKINFEPHQYPIFCSSSNKSTLLREPPITLTKLKPDSLDNYIRERDIT